jgi:hypothetical protein
MCVCEAMWHCENESTGEHWFVFAVDQVCGPPDPFVDKWHFPVVLSFPHLSQRAQT